MWFPNRQSSRSSFKRNAMKRDPLLVVDRAIFVYHCKEHHRVLLDEILYVKAEQQLIIIQTKSRPFVIPSTLSRFAAQVNEKFFVQVHRSVYVNVNHVEGFAAGIVTIGAKHLPMSKSGFERLAPYLRILRSK